MILSSLMEDMLRLISYFHGQRISKLEVELLCVKVMGWSCSNSCIWIMDFCRLICPIIRWFSIKDIHVIL